MSLDDDASPAMCIRELKRSMLCKKCRYSLNWAEAFLYDKNAAKEIDSIIMMQIAQKERMGFTPVIFKKKAFNNKIIPE